MNWWQLVFYVVVILYVAIHVEKYEDYAYWWNGGTL